MIPAIEKSDLMLGANGCGNKMTTHESCAADD
jgi:hypothetical protein